jgi:hypothetical protein
MSLLLDDALPMPAAWDRERFAIYRNAYRARIIDAIRDTYPRTERWVGEDAFTRAAIHHVILHPPTSWTLDAVGEGFATTLAALFAGDLEVSELAWLESAMHACFVSADEQSLDAAAFSSATASFSEEDWASMQLRFLPGTRVTTVRHDLEHLWLRLGEKQAAAEASTEGPGEAQSRGCVVWRQELRPVFALIDATEGTMLERMLGGAAYGDACATLAEAIGSDAAVELAGAMLGRWIHNGLLAGVE